MDRAVPRSLIVVEHLGHSSLAGTRQELEGPRLLVGRKPDCAVRFDRRRDATVSAWHAQVRADGERLLLRDVGSLNGTYLNGKRVEDETELRRGDVVRLGRTGPEMRFALAPGRA